MRTLSISDYIIPDGGWSEYYRRHGAKGACAYLANPRHLLPEIRIEYLALKRENPAARIFPDDQLPFSRLSRHKIENPKGYPRIR